MEFASAVTSETPIRQEPDTTSQGAEHKCLQEQIIRDSHSPPRRAQALRPDPPADSGTGRFETQMIGPRSRLNLSGHETLPRAEEQALQPWLGAPRAVTAAAWVAESSASADFWFKQQAAEGRASDACLQQEWWGAASVSTPQGVMDSKTQPPVDVDVSPDVDLSGTGSRKVKTLVHTVAVYDQSLSPRAAVTFSQVITPPAGLKDATPKPLETVDAGALADGAETSGLENEGKLFQVAAPMSKSQGPAGDHINATITPALGTAALNRTEDEDLRREVPKPATELAEAQRQLHCKINVLPTAMSHGGSPTIKQPDPMVKIKTSQPTQGKSAEPPQGAMTDTPAPTLALADARAKMEAAQLALEALDARYSGRAGAMPWCEHFDGIGVEWQWMEMGRKTVESSLIYTVERTSDQDDTKEKAQRSMAVKPVHTPMVDLPAQGMPKGNLPTAPAAPTLTLAGTQAAADNPLEAALGQAIREEAKLPAPSLAIEPVCTRPDAAMNPVKSDIPTANTPVRTNAGNGKMMPLRAD